MSRMYVLDLNAVRGSWEKKKARQTKGGRFWNSPKESSVKEPNRHSKRGKAKEKPAQ